MWMCASRVERAFEACKMNKTYLLIIAVALLAAPLTHAHDPAGTPKRYCEEEAEWKTHDYSPPLHGESISGLFDGNLMLCDVNAFDPLCGLGGRDADPLPVAGLRCDILYDGHSEFARGGAWILSCDDACGPNGTGAGALACFGEPAHHSSFPTIRVLDSSGLIGVEFHVITDSGGGPCGDFEGDSILRCYASCSASSYTGADGAFIVIVRGTLGHVITN